MIEFLSITKDAEYARRLWALPDNTVFVDLETVGKRDRQSSRDTVLSAHTLDDVRRLAEMPDRGRLLVRTNPVGSGGEQEANQLVELGVERLMLPMFLGRSDVERMVDALDRRGNDQVRLSLLAETDQAIRNLELIIDGQPPWVDHVHIGLNDLSIDRGTAFLFEPVATGEVAALSALIRKSGRRFGFGGVGMPGTGRVPAEWMLGEHVRVQSQVAILARSFHGAISRDDPQGLERSMELTRQWEAHWRAADELELRRNHERLRSLIVHELEYSRA